MSEKNAKVDNGVVVDTEELLEEKGEWVTIEQAAKQLGIHPRSVRRIIKTHHLETKKRTEPMSVEQLVKKVYVSMDDLLSHREKYRSFYPEQIPNGKSSS